MNQDTTTGIMIGGVQKKNTGLIIGMISCSILAIGGIGFGIWGVIESNSKSSEISDLKAQMADKDSTIATIETEKNEITKEDNATVAIVDSPTAKGGPYIENGYFFVPEWGLKFSIPNDLANYGYSVDYDSAHVGYTLPVVGFTAMLKTDELQGAQVAYYDNIETCSMVNVSKEPGTWPDDHRINGTIKQFDDYALLIWNYSSHGGCDYNLHIDEVQEKIQAMFANPENI